MPIEEADPVLLDDPEYGTALDGGKALDKAKQALRDVLVPMVVAASTGWTCRLLRRAEAIGVPGDRHASYVVTSRLAGQETEAP